MCTLYYKYSNYFYKVDLTWKNGIALVPPILYKLGI